MEEAGEVGGRNEEEAVEGKGMEGVWEVVETEVVETEGKGRTEEKKEEEGVEEEET